jgi:hypothetical protein
MRTVPVLLTLLGLSGAIAHAQPTPLTGEVLVSVSDVHSRLRPAAAADPAGGFVIVWREVAGQDGGLAGRRLDAAGRTDGPGFEVRPLEERVHTTDPRVAARGDGGFLVAWGEGIVPRPGCARARSFGRGGSGPETEPVDLGPCGFENGRAPDVALAGLPDGRFTAGFIAAWETGQAMTADGLDVVVRAFAAVDRPLGEPQIAGLKTAPGETGAPGFQTAPALAVDAAGRATLLWRDEAAGTFLAETFETSGQPLTAAVPVSGAAGGFPVQAAIAAAPDGRAVVVWSAVAEGGTRIWAQLVDAEGRKRGAPIAVSAVGPSGSVSRQQRDPAVAADADGSFAVAWDADRVDGSMSGVVARLFDRDGRPRGGAFRVNVTARGAQGHPALAFAPDGRLLIVWDSQRDAAARGSIVSRLYSTLRSVVP